jgi:hypothetical protein
VNAEHLNPLAAIAFPPSTGDALPTVQVWFDGATIPDSQSSRLLTDANDLHRQFVSEDARISKKGLFPFEGMEVCTADANASHSHAGFGCAQMIIAILSFNERQLFGTIKSNALHINLYASCMTTSAIFQPILTIPARLFSAPPKRLSKRRDA